jgi:hypothetical protein
MIRAYIHIVKISLMSCKTLKIVTYYNVLHPYIYIYIYIVSIHFNPVYN